jgi:Concanavalin A-like lectin/glucanases superfamily
MSNRFLPKRSWTANATPTTSDLVANEIAFNFADNKLYVRNPTTGNIVSVSLGGGSSGLTWSSVPASATATGTAGQIAYDGSYYYVCTATNTWGRIAVPSWDYYYSSVSLLLPMDGNNNSTGFTDAGPHSFAVTAVGDAKISTTQSKFGGSSAVFDGSGDGLSVPANSAFDFGTGDFAIEAWFYISANSEITSGQRGAAICSTWNAVATPISGWILGILGDDTTTGTGLQFDSWDPTNSGTLFRATVSVSKSTWHHVVGSVVNGTRRLYLDGTLLTNTQTITVASGYTPFSNFNNPLRVGSTQNNIYPLILNGYIDDLRITKGTGRGYTGSTIAVPTAALPRGA